LVVSSGRVLIIEADEWVSSLLSKYLGEAGYEVEVATGAREGFDKVRELEPDCILCDVNLPDIDGFWVARRVRTEPTRVATTPFLFLTDAEDIESRLQGLHVGADLYLSKPFHNEEVVAQVGAMIDMANRLRQVRDSFVTEPPSTTGATAFQGNVAHMSLATVLTLLELERRTGRLRVKGDDDRNAVLDLSEGSFAHAEIDERPWPPTAFLREVLRWKQGSFSFKTATVEAPRMRQPIGHLLLEAMRQEDEASNKK
jgi:two-component system, OmpR family, response regulator